MTETSISHLITHLLEQTSAFADGSEIADANIEQLLKTVPTVAVLNPWNNKRIYELPQLSVGQVVDSIDYAREYQPVWAGFAPSSRAAFALALHDSLVKHEKQGSNGLTRQNLAILASNEKKNRQPHVAVD